MLRQVDGSILNSGYCLCVVFPVSTWVSSDLRKHVSRWTGSSKLTLGVSVCVCEGCNKLESNLSRVYSCCHFHAQCSWDRPRILLTLTNIQRLMKVNRNMKKKWRNLDKSCVNFMRRDYYWFRPYRMHWSPFCVLGKACGRWFVMQRTFPYVTTVQLYHAGWVTPSGGKALRPIRNNSWWNVPCLISSADSSA